VTPASLSDDDAAARARAWRDAAHAAGLDTSGESVPYIAGWGDGGTKRYAEWLEESG
jgi:hypothetical protein